MREDIIVRAEDSTVRENIEQSAAASFTHARSKGRRWRKKENKKENEKKEEEKCFKWRDLYAWRRRILGSAERARENDTTRSMSTSSSSQESKHLKYRLAVCDNKSIFTLRPARGRWKDTNVTRNDHESIRIHQFDLVEQQRIVVCVDAIGERVLSVVSGTARK